MPGLHGPGIALLVTATLGGCAEVQAPPLELVGPPEAHRFGLYIDGNESDPGKQQRCARVFERAGVSVVTDVQNDRSAQLYVHLTFAQRNRLRLWNAQQGLVLDEPRPGWGVERLCEDALAQAMAAARARPGAPPVAATGGEGTTEIPPPPPGPGAPSSAGSPPVGTTVPPVAAAPLGTAGATGTTAPAAVVVPAPPPVAGGAAAPPPGLAATVARPALDSGRAYHERAQASFTSGDYTGAIVDWRSAYALEARPEFLYDIALGYYRRGLAAQNADDLRRALDQLSLFRRARPDVPVDDTVRALEDALRRLESAPPAR